MASTQRLRSAQSGNLSPSLSFFEINKSLFFEFGQFLCRKIAIVDFFDPSPILPNQRARICVVESSYSLSVVFQGTIIRTIIFNDNHWSAFHHNTSEIIRLECPYTKENLRNLVLAVADYVTLYDLPITHPFPLWLLSSYTPLIERFNAQAQTPPRRPITFKIRVDYLTRYGDYSYRSNEKYNYKDISLKFPKEYKDSENDQLYWLYTMTLGDLFSYQTKHIPQSFLEDVDRSYLAAIRKRKSLSFIHLYNGNKLPDMSAILLSRLPWTSAFEPNEIFEDTKITRIAVNENSAESTIPPLYLYFNIKPGTSPDIKAIFKHKKTPPYPLLANQLSYAKILIPVCKPDLFMGRYQVIYERSPRPISYPITFHVLGMRFLIGSRALLSQRTMFYNDPSYKNALCPIEGDLFWKPLGVCSVYNNLIQQLSEIPRWYSVFKEPTQNQQH